MCYHNCIVSGKYCRTVDCCGDFNCHYGSQYHGSFTDFIANNKLIFSDQARLNDAFTFCSDACGSCTWIDHFLCSKDVDNLVNDCMVLYDYITSDHKALTVLC